MNAHKILFVVGDLDYGGAERVLSYLCQVLNKEWHCRLLVLGKVRAPEMAQGIQVDALGAKKSSHSFFSFLKFVRREQPHVILSTLSFTNLFVALALLFSNWRGRLILRETSTHSQKFAQLSGVKFCWMWTLYRIALWKADFFLFQTRAMQDDFSQFWGFPENHKKFTVIGNPMRFEKLAKSPSSVIRAVAIGRLEGLKGFDRLIDIWARLTDQRYQLKIYGEGSDRSRLQDQIQTLNLQNRVQLMGRTDHIEKVFQESDVLLLTSRSEGLPNVILEAAGTHTPTVAYDCPGGVAEIFSVAHIGELVTDGDVDQFVKALEKVISHKDQYEFAQFKNKMGEQVLKRYRDLLMP